MPTPTLVVGAPCWIDLYSSDTEKATEFYGGLFGWTTEMHGEEFGGYFTFLKDGKHVGGCMANTERKAIRTRGRCTSRPTTSQRTAKDAHAKGGQVHLAPMQVAENGWFTIIGDPGGARHRRVAGEPGTGFEIWNEPAPPGGSSSRRRATRPRRLLHATCSSGPQHVQRHSRLSVHDAPRRRGERPRGIIRPPPPEGTHARLDDLLRGRGHGRRPRANRRARRQCDAACRGHAVWPAGAGRRSRRARRSS